MNHPDFHQIVIPFSMSLSIALPVIAIYCLTKMVKKEKEEDLYEVLKKGTSLSTNRLSVLLSIRRTRGCKSNHGPENIRPIVLRDEKLEYCQICHRSNIRLINKVEQNQNLKKGEYSP